MMVAPDVRFKPAVTADPPMPEPDSEPTRTMRCKGCERRVATPKARGPYGWYTLSVGVPRDLDPRGYIWIGMYCSVRCLAFETPNMVLQEEATADLYEHE